MWPDPRGYPGLGSYTGPAKMLHSFTPGPFLLLAQNPSLPPTPDGEQKIVSGGVGIDPGGARAERPEKKGGRVVATVRLWWRGWRRVSGQQHVSFQRRVSGQWLQIG
jgi:hypothetical protein